MKYLWKRAMQLMNYFLQWQQDNCNKLIISMEVKFWLVLYKYWAKLWQEHSLSMFRASNSPFIFIFCHQTYSKFISCGFKRVYINIAVSLDGLNTQFKLSTSNYSFLEILINFLYLLARTQPSRTLITIINPDNSHLIPLNSSQVITKAARYKSSKSLFTHIMSRNQISKVDKANFYKLKPQNKTIFDTIKNQTNNKQNLRDVIMDFIIQKLFKQNNRDKTKLHRPILPNHNFKKIPIDLEVQINGVRKKIEVNGYYILEKYIQFEKKNLYRQNNIEPLIVEILNFFDEMQQVADNINFELGQQNDLPSSIINVLLEKYNKDKQKLNRIKEFDMVKTKTIAKYTRVSYLDIQNNLQKKECQIYVQKSPESSHRVSRDTISSSIAEKEFSQTKQVKSSKSKLKDLVDNCKVFQQPEKVQKLRLQKLGQIYESNEIDKATQATKKQICTLKSQGKAKDPNQDYLQFLQDWIIDISISQKLFKQKMQQKDIKHKQSQVHVGKIIEESQNQQNEQIKMKLIQKPTQNFGKNQP